ncbi:MAG: YgeY family selenium metabolism-linked hydrolase [Firmicutes bacterium]|nr:YgeY family selenium metabolism-linked hydrolase [Bacillota bacterium]
MQDNILESLLIDCQEIIRLKSESGQEEKVASYIKNVMDRLGFDKSWIDDYGNVIGQITGEGEQCILLEGHMDTVGVERPELWNYDPYGGEIANNKLYGRGTSDMKAALMAMVYAAAAFIENKDKLKGNIVVVGIVFEEVFEGIAQGKILDKIDPDLLIIGEASSLQLCIGQRGRAEIKVTTFGKNAHSSSPDAGINAVSKMINFLQEIEKIKLPVDDFLGPAIMVLTDIKSAPYPGKSVIPDCCTVTFDRRLLPGETEETVLKPVEDIFEALQEQDKDFQAEVEIVEAKAECYTGKVIGGKRFFPGWLFKEEDTFVRKAHQELISAGFDGQLSHYSFCTDGSQSAGIRGIPTLGFGPSLEELAHVVDEYIETEQIYQAYRGYQAIIRSFFREGES